MSTKPNRITITKFIIALLATAYLVAIASIRAIRMQKRRGRYMMRLLWQLRVVERYARILLYKQKSERLILKVNEILSEEVLGEKTWRGK